MLLSRGTSDISGCDSASSAERSAWLEFPAGAKLRTTLFCFCVERAGVKTCACCFHVKYKSTVKRIRKPNSTHWPTESSAKSSISPEQVLTQGLITSVKKIACAKLARCEKCDVQVLDTLEENYLRTARGSS